MNFRPPQVESDARGNDLGQRILVVLLRAERAADLTFWLGHVVVGIVDFNFLVRHWSPSVVSVIGSVLGLAVGPFAAVVGVGDAGVEEALAYGFGVIVVDAKDTDEGVSLLEGGEGFVDDVVKHGEEAACFVEGVCAVWADEVVDAVWIDACYLEGGGDVIDGDVGTEWPMAACLG